jgi:hypothetical protein
VGATEQHRMPWYARGFLDLLPRCEDHGTRDRQEIEPHYSHPLFPIIKDGCADLAGIVEAGVVALPIAARLLHAYIRSDVSISKASSDPRFAVLGYSAQGGKQSDENATVHA